MKKFLSGSAIAAGVVLAGLMAGYWHFADLMPRRDADAPRSAVGSTSEPEDESVAVEPGEGPVAAGPDAAAPRQPAAGAGEPSLNRDVAEEAVASVAAPAAEDPALPAAETPVETHEPAETALVDSAPAMAGDAPIEEQGDAPSFELLRVEPDGSTVVAGRSAPGAEIVLRQGGEIIARDTVGPSGDFALALEAPLGVGDHELRLEAIAPNGVTVASPETAIVSVPPRGREEELLVVVEAPNAPSRILAVPSVAVAGNGEGVVASAQGPGTTAASDTQTAMLPPPADQASDAVDDVEAAAIVAVPQAPAPSETAGPAQDIAIAAVEIENERVYIAGVAKPGSTVRVYLDDALIAEAQGGAGDRFIAEATADIPVGPHIVRADQIGADGSVVARVEVPFDRPEGTSMAALAPLERTPADPAVSPPSQAASPAAEPAEAIATAASPDEPERTAPHGSTSTDPELSSRGQSSEAVDDPVPPGAPATTVPDGEASPETAVDADLDRSEPNSATLDEDVTGMPAAPAAPEQREPVAAPAGERPADDRGEPQRMAAPSPQGASPAESPSAPEPAVASGPVGTPARTQAALEQVDGRVIIRRGDTLWRISRNAYGLGSRYSVIYLANGDQIRNPDRIYPGQVFRMPGGRKAEGRSVLN